MARIRSRDTQLELTFRRALWAAGVRGWRCNVRSIDGCPDLAWKRKKLAVFIDSAWWHGHPSRWMPGRLTENWDRKIARNKQRDDEINETLSENGWAVLRFWDFQIAGELDRCVAETKKRLLAAG